MTPRTSPKVIDQIVINGIALTSFRMDSGAVIYFVEDELTDEVALTTHCKATAQDLFTALTEE